MTAPDTPRCCYFVHTSGYLALATEGKGAELTEIAAHGREIADSRNASLGLSGDAVVEILAAALFVAPAHAFPVRLSLSHYTIAMLLIDACEGSSDRWLARIDVDVDHDADVHTKAARKAIIGPTPRDGLGYREVDWPLYAVAPLVEGCSLRLHVREDDGTEHVHVIGRQAIAQAVQTLADKHPQRFAEVVGETWDGDDSDVFLQLAAFGKVIYG